MPNQHTHNKKNILETILKDIQYDDLGLWRHDDIIAFSKQKKLFDYQIEAVENIIKVLHLYFKDHNGKGELKQRYQSQGYKISENELKHINRICLWMATGSGKSLVMIKTIELLDHLQSKRLDLLPKKEILFLPPREDLLKQFQKEIDEYNDGKTSKKIYLQPLSEYENDASLIPPGYDIKVYYCLSHLLKEKRKENELDYTSFLNNGDWYLFLDEAHRGDSQDSLLKRYVNELSENGFLFNFSATFVDEIDHLTTGFNFNLEKFINAGFGKNIYLSKSYFDFNKEKNEFSETEKQKQILKSLIIFTLIKKSRKNNSCYHNPLIMTLVNTVNKNTNKVDSDLAIFFNKIEEIANGKIEKKTFQEAKKDLIETDFKGEIDYEFNSKKDNEKLILDKSSIKGLEIKDILASLFNTNEFGNFEYLEGETGKEIVLKLATSDKPFGLIRIGDTQQFIKHYLSKYEKIKNYQIKKCFQGLNSKNSEINLLMGSRAFYEGWDSNRPNVINFINIGKSDAKKFIPQAIGRGIRIEPKPNERKRLPVGDKEKNKLLETLFVFATDKKGLQDIIDNIENEKENYTSTTIELKENERLFDLLIPVFKENPTGKKFAKFNISKSSLNNFNNYYSPISKETLLLKTTSLGIDNLNLFEKEKKNDNFFQIKNEPQTDYQNMEYLLERITRHVSLKNPVVSEIKELRDEIIHFKHIKVSNLSDIEIKQLKDDINLVNSYTNTPLSEEEEKTINVLEEKGIKVDKPSNQKEFKDLKISKIVQHYYSPIIYSEQEKIDYIKHIIKVKSEVSFIEKLESHIKGKDFNFEWMFSKIDESLDKQIYIPYFYKTDNWYRKFYPDFIFWIKKGNNYKIVYIDPKGAQHADYQDKLEGFHSVFTKKNESKIFNYNKYNISFDLKLVTNDINKVPGERYGEYWISENNFEFLNL